MISTSANPLEVEVTRGSRVESRHRIDLVVAGADGSVVASRGDAQLEIYPRSAIKALQALPLVESGAAEALRLADRHIALACASHMGAPEQVSVAREILAAAGLEEKCLECGAQLPAREEDRNALARSGKGPAPIHNNCSGKHAGFLAFAAHERVALNGYVKYGHPVQEKVAVTLEAVTGAPHGADNYGIDGCSIPTWALPLNDLAVAFARFGAGRNSDPARAAAMLRIRDACLKHPEMIAGPGSFDTEFMLALAGRAFTKSGAEGVFVAALPERGLGLALKCRDGSGRASEVAVATLIQSLLPLEETAVNKLKIFVKPTLRNWSGIETGHIEAKLI